MQYEITLDDTQKQAKAALALLKTIDGVSIRPIRASRNSDPAFRKAAKKTFLKNLEEGLNEVQQIRKGKLKARPLKDLLNGN